MRRPLPAGALVAAMVRGNGQSRGSAMMGLQPPLLQRGFTRGKVLWFDNGFYLELKDPGFSPSTSAVRAWSVE